MSNADFKVFTGLLKAAELDGRKIISTTASSSVTDRHGDQITPEAIQSMARQAANANLTIFLNHEYRVPEDVFGSVVSSVATQKPDGVWELQLGIEVDETNDRALSTYRMIRGKNDDGKGRRLGVSIGALIRDYDLIDKKDLWSPMVIKDVELLEASIVGIPANPDSWVKQASKSLRKALREKAEIEETEPAIADAVDGPDVLDILEKAAPKNDPDDDGDDDSKDDSDTDDDRKKALDADPLVTDESDTHDALDTLTNSLTDEQPTSPVELTAEEQPPSVADPAPADPGPEELAVLALTDKVMTMAEKLSARDREVADLIRQRDDAVASLRLAMQFVEKLARTPLGKKTTFVEPISDFRTKFGQVYDEEFIKFLEPKNES